MINSSIVIPLFNKSELTTNCLNSLLKNSSNPSELILIDNGSTDDTAIVVQNFKEQFEKDGWTFNYVKNEKNVGFGRAMNQGARIATKEFLFLMNNDIWTMPGWDTPLIESISRLNAGMVGPYYYEKEFTSEKDIESISKEFTSRNRGKYNAQWTSVVMLFKRDFFKKIGMFDESFFVTFEDSDLKHRMNIEKYKYYRIADSFIWHKSKGTRGSSTGISNHEAEGLQIFINKWKFDPRIEENSLKQKIIKKYRKFKDKLGLF